LPKDVAGEASSAERASFNPLSCEFSRRGIPALKPNAFESAITIRWRNGAPLAHTKPGENDMKALTLLFFMIGAILLLGLVI
jgi:hypothetical protein